MEQGYKIIYLDEIVFSKSSAQTQDFSQRCNGFKIDQDKLRHGYTCAIAAVSYEQGMEHLMIIDTPVDRWIFINFLKQLREKNGRKKIAVYMDWLPAHLTRESKDAFQ